MTRWNRGLEKAFEAALVDKVPRDHGQPDHEFRRRRIVATITLILGAIVLGLSLSVRPGDAKFYPLTFLLAAIWTGGGFLSGPLHLGWIDWRGTLRRPIITPVVVGLLASAVFIVGAFVVREIKPLSDYIEGVLDHARQGSLALILIITVLNGVAEEIFFRGALFAAIGRRHPVAVSTVIYAVVTIASGNPMLVFAAATLGVVWGLQRRASGGILSSSLTHVTWSAIMLFALPPIFAGR